MSDSKMQNCCEFARSVFPASFFENLKKKSDCVTLYDAVNKGFLQTGFLFKKTYYSDEWYIMEAIQENKKYIYVTYSEVKVFKYNNILLKTDFSNKDEGLKSLKLFKTKGEIKENTRDTKRLCKFDYYNTIIMQFIQPMEEEHIYYSFNYEDNDNDETNYYIIDEFKKCPFIPYYVMNEINYILLNIYDNIDYLDERHEIQFFLNDVMQMHLINHCNLKLKKYSRRYNDFICDSLKRFVNKSHIKTIQKYIENWVIDSLTRDIKGDLINEYITEMHENWQIEFIDKHKQILYNFFKIAYFNYLEIMPYHEIDDDEFETRERTFKYDFFRNKNRYNEIIDEIKQYNKQIKELIYKRNTTAEIYAKYKQYDKQIKELKEIKLIFKKTLIEEINRLKIIEKYPRRQTPLKQYKTLIKK
jgi:hypothetical protein